MSADVPSTPTEASHATTSAPPVTRYRIATASPDEALEHMGSKYTRIYPDLTPREGFEFCIEGAFTDSFAIDFLRHSAHFSARAEPPEHLVVAQPARGTQLRNSTARQDARGPLVLAPSSSYSVEWQDATMVMVTLDRQAVTRLGAEISGLDEHLVTFTDSNPLSLPLARAWAGLSAHVRRDLLANEDALASPLARAETFRHLAGRLLATFPNTALDALDDPTAAGPSRRPCAARRSSSTPTPANRSD